jgi:hypothetical protein
MSSSASSLETPKHPPFNFTISAPNKRQPQTGTTKMIRERGDSRWHGRLSKFKVVDADECHSWYEELRSKRAYSRCETTEQPTPMMDREERMGAKRPFKCMDSGFECSSNDDAKTTESHDILREPELVEPIQDATTMSSNKILILGSLEPTRFSIQTFEPTPYPPYPYAKSIIPSRIDPYSLDLGEIAKLMAGRYRKHATEKADSLQPEITEAQDLGVGKINEPRRIWE